MNKNIIELALQLAVHAHTGQTRNDGKTPYIIHPRRVAISLQNESPQVVAAAWLHDVLEDTTMTEHTIFAAGIPPRVIAAVKALTRREDQPYDEYLSQVAFDEIARKVKIADILDNLGDKPSENQFHKYVHALKFLTSVKATIPEGQ